MPIESFILCPLWLNLFLWAGPRSALTEIESTWLRRLNKLNQAKKRSFNVALLQIWKKPVFEEGEREMGCLPPSLLPCKHFLLSLLLDWFLPNST